MQGMWFLSLSGKDPLGKELATHASIHAWEIHGQRAWQATVHGVAKELDMT